MYYVTGVSRGLGKAVVLALLKRGEQVTGIGRSHDIDDPAFTFICCDLSDTRAAEQLQFPDHSEPVVLINNAAVLGNIDRISAQDSADLESVLRLNSVTPMLLARKLYQTTRDKNAFTLVNISSGAARRAIPSWAAYCASKAALNMLSETFRLEELELGRNPRVYAVAPGVIDTDMQAQIREVDQSRFSARGNFIGLKENGELFSAEEAANRLIRLLDRPYTGEVMYDLRKV